MLAFIGPGSIDLSGAPADAATVRIRSVDAAATVSLDTGGAASLTLIVARAACARLFGELPDEPATWHLPSELRVMALAILDCELPEPLRTTMRLAKCIELFCSIFQRLSEDALVPADAAGSMSELDCARLISARRLIDERWHEKLTLDTVARASGLNRAKLTRGFRGMFGCSVADALTANRLGGARSMLLATDLPVSSVGYRCGYLNNASFTRAFTRRFGVAPTQLRSGGLQA